ncbi:hypothetical protein V5O48_002699 [Marasmius crinis-equi]|uniref:COQ9 C-terminal domain-containing protein n=1 Tax=Marasmius crinis-equi TaxID=585013 RepID=A0ABR3FUX0_9AGAR
MSSTRNQLLRVASTLIKTHGFTREALANSVLHLPQREAPQEPLNDLAVSALFGSGDTARVALITAWLEEGLNHMRKVPTPSVREILLARLDYNRDVLKHLPEAFALLCSPENGWPPVDPRPALKHAATVANETCIITQDRSLQLDWYARRASLATVYSAAELHQLKSPESAGAFLDDLLSASETAGTTLREAQVFSSYVYKSWNGILKSKGFW